MSIVIFVRQKLDILTDDTVQMLLRGLQYIHDFLVAVAAGLVVVVVVVGRQVVAVVRLVVEFLAAFGWLWCTPLKNKNSVTM